ncbi:MAG: cation-translocating P-type ATPase [Minisyncoccia bacterium]|jgi:heavy metal translocating P-type ATPase
MTFIFRSPDREYLLIIVVAFALIINLFFPAFSAAGIVLWIAALFGALPTVGAAASALYRRKVTIDTFNVFALAISFATREIRSAAFIVLMLTFAYLLDWYTESRTENAVAELLRLKPEKARRLKKDGAKGDMVEEVRADDIKMDNILLVQDGDRVPADGVIVFGNVLVNESSVTGESVPVPKREGDRLLSGTLIESGTAKFRATGVGKDSTLERMAGLIREAQKNKSRSERLADRFAAIFLPIVLVFGLGVYIVTGNILMTAALFLVACADDMAVAIPLAVTAALGRAASRGVVVKGGEWLDALGKTRTLVLDKTGTLTYGSFALRDAEIVKGISPDLFWQSVGVAEKFSEHPVGRAIFKAALEKLTDVASRSALPDPDEVKIHRGNGIWVRYGGAKRIEVAIGDEGMCADLGLRVEPLAKKKLKEKKERFGGTTVLVAINKKCAGLITVADVPREEAAESMRALRKLGVQNITMFTGDNEAVAAAMTKKLGLASYSASMSPEEKLRKLEMLLKDSGNRAVAMVGDGINDAPALARADVGIAMGNEGAAVAVEAADIVVLTDNLARIPEMVSLGRRTASVIKWDMVIWVVSNAVGFALVLTGFAGPAIAAFYNFATDFLPLINSARLFRRSSSS